MDELCNIGQKLWDNYRSTCEGALYKNYMNHIISCLECQQKLELAKDDVAFLNINLDEDKLKEFKNENKNEVRILDLDTILSETDESLDSALFEDLIRTTLKLKRRQILKED